MFRETDEETGLKVRALLTAGMVPVLCVGELLEEREDGRTEEVVSRQIAAGLAKVDAGELAQMVIAYEPVWAIGTGRNATPDDAASVHAFIRGLVVDRGGPEDIRLLYGGSVNPSNAKELFGQADVDGGLVGGASLQADSLVGIANGL